MPVINIRLLLSSRYKKIKGSFCYYCGDLATCYDHTIPVSYLIKTREHLFDIPLLPSCTECNNLLGSFLFKSLEDRKAFVKKKLKKKYNKVLKSALWSEEELNELGPELQMTIRSMEEEKNIILKRLKF